MSMTNEPTQYTNAELAHKVIDAVDAIQDAHVTLASGVNQITVHAEKLATRLGPENVATSPMPGRIPVAGTDGRLDAGWLPDGVGGVSSEQMAEVQRLAKEEVAAEAQARQSADNTLEGKIDTALANASSAQATANEAKSTAQSAAASGPMYNTRTVLTASGTFTAPVTGWYEVTCIGGGGGGGKGGPCHHQAAGNGGQNGGTTSFGSHVSAIGGGGGGGGSGGVNAANTPTGGGGGAAGRLTSGVVHLTKNSIISYTVGSGGAGATSCTKGIQTLPFGRAGQGTGAGGQTSANAGGLGASGAGHGHAVYSCGGPGGGGGSNGTGYGGGGGGGGGLDPDAGSSGAGGTAGDNGTNGMTCDISVGDIYSSGNGGNGGPGAIILCYYDPAKANG